MKTRAALSPHSLMNDHQPHPSHKPTAKVFARVDVIVAPSDAGDSVLLSNLTGHPSVVVPNGFTKAGTPTSICFIGKLFGEAELLALAKKYQDATDHHRRHPTLSP